MRTRASRALYVLLLLLGWGPWSGVVSALSIADPSEIRVHGLVSLGEDGAAWLSWGGRELLVTPGYMIGRDLRVTAIRQDSVVLYRPLAREYFALPVETEGKADRDRTATIWSTPLPLWKIVRMIALAYRKDYICHWQTRFESAPRGHCHNVHDMLRQVVTPNHRFYGREGVYFVAPVHTDGKDWKILQRRVRAFPNRRLAQKFPSLQRQVSFVADGKPLQKVLDEITWKTGVPIKTPMPLDQPIFCSFRDRSWSEILEHVVIFNGLGLEVKGDDIVVILK
jgi:hypothetical protein